MDKQKALLKTLLTALSMENADAVISSLFPADDKTEPSLDVDAVLAQAQEYSKPFLEEEIRISEKKNFKTQYDNDLLGKLAQASGGLVKTTELVELKDLKKATDLVISRIKESVGKPDAEKDEMIRKLNEQLEEKEQEKTNEIDKVRKEFSDKEEERTKSDKGRAWAGKKSLAVSADVASEAVLTRLSKDYTVKYNASTEKFELFDKADPTKKAKKSETKYAEFDEEADSILNEYKWIAKSKGTQDVSEEQRQQQQRQQQQQQDQQNGQQGRRRSKLGQVLERVNTEGQE